MSLVVSWAWYKFFKTPILQRIWIMHSSLEILWALVKDMLLCLSGHNKKGSNRTMKVKRPSWKQRNMFWAIINIMWEEQLIDLPIHHLKANMQMHIQIKLGLCSWLITTQCFLLTFINILKYFNVTPLPLFTPIV